MVKCEKCGAENLESDSYCQKCGNNLNEFPTKYGDISLLGFGGLFFFIPLVLICILFILVKTIPLRIFIKLLIFFIIPFICGIYLQTRPESFAKKRGKFITQISFGVLLFFVIVGLYLYI